VFGKLRIVVSQGNPPQLALTDVEPNGVVGKLGLRESDALLSVMGRSISTPEAALQAYSEARNAAVIPYKVLRAGKTIELLLRVVTPLGPT
jgi:S1-C subfamily serine protease